MNNNERGVKLFTQCRGCGEIFSVVVDDLVTAEAMVRCSSCGAVFNSLDTLSDYRPQEGADLMLHDTDNPPPLLTHEYKKSVVRHNVQETVPITANELAEKLDEESIFNIKPDFVTDKKTTRTKKPTLLWVMMTLVLSAVLLWQSSTAIEKGSLVLPNGWLKQNVCQYLDCHISAKKTNLNKIALVSRSIRQHPGRDNALIITTGIINSDEKIQGFPALQVKMSNLNGEIVAMRRFLPGEYIDEETVAVGMLPNTLIPITLELQSPGNNAVTFEVGFSSTFGKKYDGSN